MVRIEKHFSMYFVGSSVKKHLKVLRIDLLEDWDFVCPSWILYGIVVAPSQIHPNSLDGVSSSSTSHCVVI